MDDGERYVARIRWTSEKDHLEGFRRGPLFGEFFAAVRPYVASIEEMRHYELTSVVGSGGASAGG